MAIRTASCLHRNRFGVFYFRKVIPADLLHCFSVRELYRSLRTASSREATKAAQILSVRIQALFDQLRESAMAGKKQQKFFQTDLKIIWENENNRIEVEYEPEEARAVLSEAMTTIWAVIIPVW